MEDKGLSEETADKIGLLVQKHGEPEQLLAELKQDGSIFLQHAGAAAALDELGVLFKYMKAGSCLHQFVFDLSLARGLDYYTGLIFEAVFKGSVQVSCVSGVLSLIFCRARQRADRLSVHVCASRWAQ